MELVKYLRRSLELTEKLSVSLQDELDFVRTYIELERGRVGEDFVATITVEDGLDATRIMIPSMIVQIPVENAIKHGLAGKDGKKELMVYVSRETNGIRITVTDNGRGYLPQVVSATRGTGTGLKVLYQTIQLLNTKNKSDKIRFNITNRSDGQTGTEVSVYIPFMMETEEKYKVVIVDDERTAIDALRRELEPYREFEVKGIAGNGAKGKKMIMELHPDLLFLDVELPDTLGLNLLSEIREDILWDMKVVFYTSYDKYLLQALRESAFDFLLKPFEAEDLKVIMDRYRKAMTSTSLPLLPSFASSISALMPQQGMFMISTVTGFKLLRLEEIGFFEYLKDKRQWQVVLFNQTCLNLKRNTKAEDIISYSQAFVQISQSAIVNVNYLAMIDGKCCQLYPPFHDKNDLIISRSYLKELQERFFVL